ncbi:MAG: hypothetical protein MGG11_05790 [Trichodesmium sp. MAG_R03]|nr:hypothetical protein [Trichodesmium sp. MAG_R03]
MFQEWLKTVNYPELFQIWVGDNYSEHFYWYWQNNAVENLESLHKWQTTSQVFSCCGLGGGKLELSGARMGMP